MYTLITDLTATEMYYLREAIIDAVAKANKAGDKKEAEKIAKLYVKIYKNAEKRA